MIVETSTNTVTIKAEKNIALDELLKMVDKADKKTIDELNLLIK